MNKELDEAWRRAEQNLGEVIDIGDTVVCDSCNADYTHSSLAGGFLFGSYGICPLCAPEYEADVIRFNEQRFIKARAEPGESFKSFILRIRNGNNTIRISKL